MNKSMKNIQSLFFYNKTRNYHEFEINDSTENCNQRKIYKYDEIFETIEQRSEKMYIDPRMIMSDTNELNNNIQIHSLEKPSLSYSQLITEALESNKEKKLTLSQIYAYIREKYPFYRQSDIVWQNSIRHNLSLNKNFRKMKRPKHLPGKGGFWILESAYMTSISESDDNSYENDSTCTKDLKNQKSVKTITNITKREEISN